MNDSHQEAVASVFQFPDRLSRRHGPQGYVDYSSYKPWLRDEFLFRCAYCLNRERWEPNGLLIVEMKFRAADSFCNRWQRIQGLTHGGSETDRVDVS